MNKSKVFGPHEYSNKNWDPKSKVIQYYSVRQIRCVPWQRKQIILLVE